MISYEESQEILSKHAGQGQRNGVEVVCLEVSVGRVCGDDIFAKELNPPFANAAMDGFAIVFDTVFGNEFEFQEQWKDVAATILAGDQSQDFKNDSSKVIEIMTGAKMPKGYDTVIRVEDTEVRCLPNGHRQVRFKKRPQKGDNVRMAGEDIQVGDLLIQKGSILNKYHLVLLASQGISEVVVVERTRVSIITTGKEIVEFTTQQLKNSEVRDSSSIFLKTALVEDYSQVVSSVHPDDEKDSYILELNKAFAAGAEIVISTGAVSMGVHDYVACALADQGFQIHFHKCAIRPGKPILFASRMVQGRCQYVFGIPGNPVSTVVGYNFFVRPFLLKKLGLQEDKKILARLAEDIKKPEGLRCFYKAKATHDGMGLMVESLKGQASFMVSPFKDTNSWIVLPEEGSTVPKGQLIEVQTL